MNFDYTPDEDIQVHAQGAIRHICAPFQTHENGLPEWIKNASDEYARSDAPGQRRVVVVVFDSHPRRGIAPSISVLDFSGMTSESIEANFRVWADPEAASRGASKSKVQGGHGNGGKCYMTMLFEEHALLHTVKDGKGNRYGVRGGSVQFGYIPDRAGGRDYPVVDVKQELTAALAGIGVSYASLPQAAQLAFESGGGFTLITGRKPKGLRSPLPVNHLVNALADHPQMAVTLDFANVYVVSSGSVLTNANPLKLEPVTPDPAFSEERVVEIPEELVDPYSSQRLSTTGEGQLDPGRLILRTSDKSMRWGRKVRHMIVYRSSTDFIGFRPVPEFDVQSPYRDRIYGECELPSIEQVKQNQRGLLADSPLTRAVESFIATAIQEYAKEFEARDKRKDDQREKTELSRINEALDRWKNQFMTEYIAGLWGPGGDGPPPPPSPPAFPSGTPKRIEVTLSHDRSGIGVSFRPTIKFYDKESRRIRPTEFLWFSKNTNVAWVDPDLNVVTTFSHGKTEIWAETLDGRVISNKSELEVVRIAEVTLDPLTLEVPTGSRRKIDAICRLSSGELISDIYLVWFESNPTVAQVSSAGNVFGHAQGATEVVAGDDRVMALQPVMVSVVEAAESGDGPNRGRGLPKILVSGVDDDPETGESVDFAKDDPPVWQRPQDVDRNIWWINSSAPFARMYLDQSKGYGYSTREWRMYHLERLIDIMVQIALASDPNNENMDIGSWLLKWGERVAEIQTAEDVPSAVEIG